MFSESGANTHEINEALKALQGTSARKYSSKWSDTSENICASCYITWKCTLTSSTAGRSGGSTSSLQRGLQVHTRVWLVFFSAVTGHLAVCNKCLSTTHVTFRAAQFLCNGNTTYECLQHPSIRVKLVSISPDISEDKVTKSKRTGFNVREVCCTGDGDEAEEKSSVQIYRNDL